MRRVRSETPDTDRQKLYKQAIIIAIGGNAVLAAAKGIVAWLSGSSAIFSDAANSLSDTLYSIFMGIGLFLSQQPADETHPQGHSRFEPFVSLLIAITIAVAGVTAIYQGLQRFLIGGQIIKAGWPTIVLIASMLIKVIMYSVVRRLGKDASSPAIRASARDNLVDTISSAAALVGVWGAKQINMIFDPVAGILVGLWIFRTTWEIISENVGYLTGRGAPKELSDQIAAIGKSISGVDDVHHVIAEYVGPQMRVDMHINVNGHLTLDKAHEIGEKVRAKVEKLAEVDLVFIHVEPTKF